jgi:SAM-dependent methyltransferase
VSDAAEPADAPSPLLLEHLDAIRRAARSGPVVDLACGRGRHARALAERGIATVAIDRDAAALRALQGRARTARLRIDVARADLESARFLPVAPASCGALLVFRYLHRPLAPLLCEILRPAGLLLYETFTIHQRKLGYGPVNPAFLLEPGELPTLFPGLEVLSFWEGIAEGARPAAVARLAARRPEGR